MSCVFRWVLLSSLLAMSAAALAAPAGHNQRGKPELKSAGVLAFGPKGVLFVADPQGAQVFAIDVGKAPSIAIGPGFRLDAADQKIAEVMGIKADDISINDIVVEPGTNLVYVSVSRTKNVSADPVIIRVDGNGAITILPLDNISYSVLPLTNFPRSSDKKGQSLINRAITDMAFVDGRLYVANRSNGEFSTIRSVEFPFNGIEITTSVEAYFPSYDRIEARKPPETFLIFPVMGKPQLLAAYVGTPLVILPTVDMRGNKVRGKTVAELGNANMPLDMIAYKSKADGKEYLLLSNTNRGVMKIHLEGIEIKNRLPRRSEATQECRVV